MKKPNILLFFADQVRPDALGCSGGRGDTPNLDSIAAEGIRFSNCYTPAPLCVPARVCLALGRYAHSTGAWNNLAYTMSASARTWMQNVRGAGYNTALIGKTHLHSGKDLYETEELLHSYGYDYVLEVEGPHANCKSINPMTDEWKKLGLFELYCADMDKRKGAVVRPSPLPLEEYYDNYVGRKGKEWLESYKGDSPWFCTVSFPGPHEPWDTPKPYSDMYSPDDMIPPRPRLKKLSEERPRGIFDELEAKEKLQCDEATARRLRADYAGGMKLIDDRVGEILEVVRKRGEMDNTIIVFTSDHGELNGDYGLIHKRNYFRNVVNVPLIIRTPETAKDGAKISDALVSMADLGPTLAELSGNPIDYEQSARSLCPIMNGKRDEIRDFVISECSHEIMYADRKWKAVINSDTEVYQLFDLENDPEESLNLAGDARYSEIEKEIRLKLFKEVMDTTMRVPAVAQGRDPVSRKK